MNHIYLIWLVVLKRPVFQTQKYGMPRQNIHSLLGFPKLNQPVFILPSEANAPLELFCHLKNPICWIGQVIRTVHLD